MSRRTLLKSCTAATVAGPASAATTRPAEPGPLPTNPLGKTGVKVTRLGMGAGYPFYDATLLEHAYKCGIRYFDNAYGYGNGKQEAVLGKWVVDARRRSDIFIVTKDGLTSPDLFYQKVVRALENLQIDTVDLMGIHNLEEPDVALDRSKEWQRLKDRLVREKKVRFMGFSTHAEMPRRVECIANAAKSGWLDMVMVPCDPLLLRTHDELNRALDACAKAGVGLVAMKTTRGLGLKAARRRGLPEGQAKTETMPPFDTMGLSAFGAVHHGMYSDGRFAAVCSAMLNRSMIDENTGNARRFDKPLTPEQWKWLEEGMKQLARTTCPACDGSCRRAAGTQADFCSIARYLAYAEQDGNRQLARQLYRRLAPHLRDWQNADLDAASSACSAKLDFRGLLHRASEILG